MRAFKTVHTPHRQTHKSLHTQVYESPGTISRVSKITRAALACAVALALMLLGALSVWADTPTAIKPAGNPPLVLTANQDATWSFNVEPATARGTFELVLADLAGTEIHKTAERNSDDATVITVPNIPQGYYYVTATLNGQTWTSALTVVPAGAVPQERRFGLDAGLSWPNPQSLSGNNSSSYAADRSMEMIAMAGIGTIRDRLSWPDVYDSQTGTWNWDKESRPWLHTSNTYRSVAEAAANNNIAVMQVLAGAPAYTRPAGVTGTNIPLDYDKVYEFGQQFALGMGDKVEAIEYWNEQTGGLSFGGYPFQYASGLKAFTAGVKSVDPSMRVLIGSSPTVALGRFEQETYNSAVADDFDTRNHHFYGFTIAEDANPNAKSLTDRFADGGQIENSVQDKPMWLTEAGRNIDPSADAATVRASEIKQAEYLVQTYAEAFALGYERVFYFYWQEYWEGSGTIEWGITRSDLSTRPAYYSLSLLTRHLAGASVAKVDTYKVGSKTVGQIVYFTRDTGEVRAVSWGEGNAALPTGATIQDVFGAAVTPEEAKASTASHLVSDLSIPGTAEVVVVPGVPNPSATAVSPVAGEAAPLRLEVRQVKVNGVVQTGWAHAANNYDMPMPADATVEVTVVARNASNENVSDSSTVTFDVVNRPNAEAGKVLKLESSPTVSAVKNGVTGDWEFTGVFTNNIATWSWGNMTASVQGVGPNGETLSDAVSVFAVSFPPQESYWLPNRVFEPGDTISSPNGRVEVLWDGSRLVESYDGVEVRAIAPAGAAKLEFKTDGDFAIYNPAGDTVWSADTVKKWPYCFIVLDDGTVQISVPSRTFWTWEADYTPLPAQPPATYHQVTFQDFDGAVIEAQTVIAGTAALAPTPPARSGYAFVGWDADFTVVTSDLVITAQYEPVPCTVSFARGTTGRGAMAAATVVNGATYTVPTSTFTTETGCVFESWLATGAATGIYKPGDSLVVTGDVTLTAQWGWEPLPAELSAGLGKGVNLHHWFQVIDSKSNGTPFWAFLPENANDMRANRKFTEDDFKLMKKLGIDHVRLPVSFNQFTLGDADHTLDPRLFDALDEAIEWGQAYGMKVIIDYHPVVNIPFPDLEDGLNDIWRQVAEHYNDPKYGDTDIYYETLNEPFLPTDDPDPSHDLRWWTARWGELQGELIATIRTVDERHTIIVKSIGDNQSHLVAEQWSFLDFTILPDYEKDLNLKGPFIYTFHFYEPGILTLKGTNTTNSVLADVDIPFPYDASRWQSAMPAGLSSLSQAEWNNYEQRATAEYLGKRLDAVVQFAYMRQVPVYAGEYGVHGGVGGALKPDRLRWLATITELLEERNFDRAVWGYNGSFGLFSNFSGGVHDQALLDTDVLAAVGFNQPAASAFYQVCFVDFDGTVLLAQTVEEGAAAAAPVAPLRTGYTFTGWDTAFSVVTSDLVISAQYTPVLHTVSFRPGERGAFAESTSTVAYGAPTPAAPPTTAEPGWVFVGWTPALAAVVTDNVTYTAVWEELPAQPPVVTPPVVTPPVVTPPVVTPPVVTPPVVTPPVVTPPVVTPPVVTPPVVTPPVVTPPVVTPPVVTPPVVTPPVVTPPVVTPPVVTPPVVTPPVVQPPASQPTVTVINGSAASVGEDVYVTVTPGPAASASSPSSTNAPTDAVDAATTAAAATTTAATVATELVDDTTALASGQATQTLVQSVGFWLFISLILFVLVVAIGIFLMTRRRRKEKQKLR